MNIHIPPSNIYYPVHGPKYKDESDEVSLGQWHGLVGSQTRQRLVFEQLVLTLPMGLSAAKWGSSLAAHQIRVRQQEHTGEQARRQRHCTARQATWLFLICTKNMTHLAYKSHSFLKILYNSILYLGN